ncbi:MAG: glycogen debranching enzyme N-terminal domain-containing protein [Candidatus Eisenbacteria bacterium]
MANGLGGYAAGTAVDVSTRRSHALLSAAGPHGRLVTLLLRLDERLQVRGDSFELSSHPFRADSCRLSGGPVAFDRTPWPAWRYEAGGVEIEKALLPITGHNAVVVRYRHLSGPQAKLVVAPVTVQRAPGAVQVARDEVPGVIGGVPGRVQVSLGEGSASLTFWHNGSFLPARVWQTGLAYPNDDDHACDDAFVPGHVETTLQPAGMLHLVFADDRELFRKLARGDRLGAPPPATLAACVALLEQGEREEHARRGRDALAGADRTARQAATAHGDDDAEGRRAPLVHAGDGWTEPLARAVLAGLTRRTHGLTVLERLPQAEERVAGTLRALPGMLSVRAFEPAREILAARIEYLSEGLAPESFDLDDGTPRYGSPEPSLWLIAAAELYARRSDDAEFAKRTLFPALEGVMQFFRAGTHHGVCVDTDGLLGVTRESVTEKPAALNVLWSHALVAMAHLARGAGRREHGAFYLAWAHEHQRRFLEAFWDGEAGCLFESLRNGVPVVGLSASQLLALSHAPSLLPAHVGARLLETIERELATPYGLRPAPGDSVVETEWLGAWHAARLRGGARSREIHARVLADLQLLRRLLETHGGVERIPARISLIERAPAGGTVSNLAAAELLRTWVEEVPHEQRVAERVTV